MLYKKIVAVLNTNDCTYRQIHHSPVYSSADVIEKLGTNLLYESKSIALQTIENIIVITIPINTRLDISKFKQALNIKKVSFLKPGLIEQILETEIGAIAPFGYSKEVMCLISSIFLDRKFLYFNPGKHNTTIMLSSNDLQKLSQKGIITFIDFN